MRAAIILIFLTGCATAYQPKGFSGGYYHLPAGKKNRFVVGFSGNGYTSADKVREYNFRRAQELCEEEGYDGYKLMTTSEDSGSTYIPAMGYSPASVVQKPRSEIIIECEEE